MLTRLKLGFSHLREHKFRHGFHPLQDGGQNGPLPVFPL